MTGPSVIEFACIERQRRHLALRIDLQEIVAVFELLGAQVDLDQIVGQAGLQKRDMGESEQAPGE